MRNECSVTGVKQYKMSSTIFYFFTIYTSTRDICNDLQQ